MRVKLAEMAQIVSSQVILAKEKMKEYDDQPVKARTLIVGSQELIVNFRMLGMPHIKYWHMFHL